MSDYRAQIISPWIDAATHPRHVNGARLWLDYPPISGSDVTGQPAVNLIPDPSMYVVEAEYPEAVLDTIAADPLYLILWSEVIINAPQ